MATKDRLDQHWKKLRRSKANPEHLTHVDLFDETKSGQDKRVFHSPVLKIVDVSIGLTKSRENPDGEEMTFLHFQGIRRKLGLNATNSETLESLTGTPIPRGWVGFTIQLYVDPQAKYPGGKKGPAIRIRPMLPKTKANDSPLPTVPEDDRERLENEQAERLGEPGQEG